MPVTSATSARSQRRSASPTPTPPSHENLKKRKVSPESSEEEETGESEPSDNYFSLEVEEFVALKNSLRHSILNAKTLNETRPILDHEVPEEVMTTAVKKLVTFVVSKKGGKRLGQSIVVEIYQTILNDNGLYDETIARVFLWTMVLITKDIINHLDTQWNSRRGLRYYGEIRDMLDQAFLKALKDLDLEDDRTVEELVAMLNHLPEKLDSVPPRVESMLREGRERIWPHFLKKTEGFEHYFSVKVESDDISKGRESDKREICNVMKEWGKTNIKDYRQQYFNDISKLAQLVHDRNDYIKTMEEAFELLKPRLLFAEPDKDPNSYPTLEFLKDSAREDESELTSWGWVSFYTATLWTTFEATKKCVYHRTNLCKIARRCLGELLFRKAHLSKAGVKTLEVWKVAMGLSLQYSPIARENGDECTICSQFPKIVRKITPLDIEETAREGFVKMDCKTYFYRAFSNGPWNSTQVEVGLDPEPEEVVEAETEASNNVDPEIPETPETKSVNESVSQETVKMETESEKVLVMPAFRPLELEEILSCGRSQFRGTDLFRGQKDSTSAENATSPDPETTQTTNNQEFMSDNSWPLPKENWRSQNEPRNFTLSHSCEEEKQNNGSQSKTVPAEEKPDEDVMIALPNPICPNLFLDFQSISRKQGIRKKDEKIQVVYFLEKSSEAEEIARILEAGAMSSNCCNSI